MNTNKLEKEIFEELKLIKISNGENLISANLISSINIDGNKAAIVIEVKNNLTSSEAHKIRDMVEQLVKSHIEVETATVVLTGKFIPAEGSIKVESKSGAKMDVAPPSPKEVAGIKKIILVGSGKGGVGKSTVAANLAVSLALKNLKIGLVDADIYGPSVAKIMGLSTEPKVEDNKMIPPIAHGVKCMSMGLILGENVPVVWRGPMVSKALQQLMYGANWGDLDILIVDLPPGTGDIHLSIAQNFKSDGVIMVSTPQEVALLDVKKAISMFEKVNVPILGIVENMSYFIDPQSGNKTEIFGTSAVAKFCEQTGLKSLAKLPLTPQVAINADAGKPAILDSEFLASEFEKICASII